MYTTNSNDLQEIFSSVRKVYLKKRSKGPSIGSRSSFFLLRTVKVGRSIWGNAYLVKRGLSSQHPATHHLIESWTSPPRIRILLKDYAQKMTSFFEKRKRREISIRINQL